MLCPRSHNDVIAAALDGSGRLAQLIDLRTCRALIVPGWPGNRYVLFEDMPTYWDAWDLEVTHLDKGWDAGCEARGTDAGQGRPEGNASNRYPWHVPGAEVEITEAGPLRASVRVRFPLSCRSQLRQTISLDCLSAR